MNPNILSLFKIRPKVKNTSSRDFPILFLLDIIYHLSNIKMVNNSMVNCSFFVAQYCIKVVTS
ncbi:hypothetical protein ACHAXS_011167 [Conticribra weissflogii]